MSLIICNFCITGVSATKDYIITKKPYKISAKKSSYPNVLPPISSEEGATMPLEN